MEKINISWPGWETVRLIGRGSFGEVYEIQRKVFDDTEKAALKVISIPQNISDIEEMYSDGYDDESITSTFQSHLKSIVAEYSLMKKMNDCINIVHCDDVRYVQHDDGIGWDIFIKMELLTPLTKTLPSDISEELVIKLGMDICRALMACSKYGIIHRDIKPQNIFVSSNGDYKLGDFGIAKTVEKTMGGTKIGTYKYMAPEVYNNQPYGQGADIYSLGLVLYSLLNERRMPFMPLPPVKLQAGMDEEARVRRFSGEPITAPAHGSEKLKQIIMKACAFDPKARYQTAGEMLNELMVLSDSNQDSISKSVMNVERVYGTAKQNGVDVEVEINSGGEVYVKRSGVTEDSTEDIGDDSNDNFGETGCDGSNGITDNKSKKGKKIIITIGLGIVLFLLLHYCIHIHNWSNATCTMPRVCECGETEGNPLGHQWLNATCTQAQTCTRCGAAEGNSLGHQWQNATCTQAQTCTRCGVTGGSSLGHQWKNATCTEPQTCIRCGVIEGSALEHQWQNATCTQPQTCTRCRETDGEALDHAWNLSLDSYQYKCSRCEIVKNTIVQDSNIKAFGKCGDSVAWAFSEDGTLTVFGKGTIYDYTYPENTPWYKYRENIKRLVVGDGITKIGMYAFGYCSSLCCVELANSVKIVKQNAFAHCTSLTEISFLNNLETIGASAFWGCSSLIEITVPESVTAIEMGAFGNCVELIDIIIPKNVKIIGQDAFDGCIHLLSITILNPNIYCVSDDNDHDGTLGVPELTVVHAYKNSDAQKYAEKFGYEFVPLD